MSIFGDIITGIAKGIGKNPVGKPFMESLRVNRFYKLDRDTVRRIEDFEVGLPRRELYRLTREARESYYADYGSRAGEVFGVIDRTNDATTRARLTVDITDPDLRRRGLYDVFEDGTIEPSEGILSFREGQFLTD